MADQIMLTLAHLPDSMLFWIAAILGVLMTGISKSGFAGGAGVLAVPLLALFMPAATAIAVMLPLLLLMDIKTIRLYRSHINRIALKQILPAAILGIMIGGVLLGTVTESILLLVLGITSITFALWQSVLPGLKQLGKKGRIWGTLSGITSTLLHAGGPPINVYFISSGLPKLNWLGTAAVFFGAMNLIKVIPYGINGQFTLVSINGDLSQSGFWLLVCLLIPIALIGVSLGKWIQQRIPEELFLQVCKGLLLLSGIALIFKAL